MKRHTTSIAILSAGMIFFSATSCDNKEKKHEMTTENATSLYPKGDKTPSEYFTGNAYLTMLLKRDKNNDFSMGSVTFEPGARTNWHTHPKGQVLIVTGGDGFYQEKGKPAQALKKGDVVNIPENTEHWHGAAAKSEFTHIAVTNFKEDESVAWLQPVLDEEYKKVNEQ